MISAADELPLRPVPSEPFWSENYYFVAHDPVADLSLVIHMGRWSKDNGLWREQAIVFLPEGSYAIAHAIGGQGAANGPKGAALRLQCDEPRHRWRLRYLGAARPTAAGELGSGVPLPQRHGERLELDLRFESRAPIWDFGRALEGQSWVSFHYEQPGRITGKLSFAGTRHAFDGIAYRDHSRGVRSYDGIRHGIWMQGHFEDRTFALLDTAFEGRDDKMMARIFYDGREFEASCEGLPDVRLADRLPLEFEILLRSELGDMPVRGRMTRALPKAFDARNEPIYGTAVLDGTALVARVGPVAFEWAEQQGFGHADFCWGPNAGSGASV